VRFERPDEEGSTAARCGMGKLACEYSLTYASGLDMMLLGQGRCLVELEVGW